MDVLIIIGKYINSLSQFSLVLTLEEKVKHHKRKNNCLDSSGRKKKVISYGLRYQAHHPNTNVACFPGQNGPLALIFEIFSNRALFRK